MGHRRSRGWAGRKRAGSRRAGFPGVVVLVAAVAALVVAGGSAGVVTASGAATTLPAVAGAGGLGPLVRSDGSYPTAPAGSSSAGPVPASRPLSLAVVLKLPDPAAVARAVRAVVTAGSPSYHHYLAPGQFAARFGPRPATITAVDRWLRGRGLRPGTAIDDLVVPVRASAGVAERAFGLTMHLVRLRSGRTAQVPGADPLVPASLTAAVAGISGLDTVSRPVPSIAWPGGLRPRGSRPRGSRVRGQRVRGLPVRGQRVRAAARDASLPGGGSRSDRRRPGPSGGGSGLAAGRAGSGSSTITAAIAHGAGPTSCAAAEQAAAGGGYTFAQLASAYGFTSLYDQGRLGQGVTIAAVELEPFLASDLAAFDACSGLQSSVSVVPVDGGAGTGAGVGEAALDVESLSALAPDAHILAYEAPNSSTGTDSDYAAIVAQDRAQVITTSWGQCEPAMTSANLDAETAAFEQATLQGQTVVAASGDSGSEDCFLPAAGVFDSALAVDDPGSQPWVTSVGGVSLLGVSSTGAPEQAVWNSCEGDLSQNGQPSTCATDPARDDGAGGGGLSQIWAMPSYQTSAGLPGDLPEDSGRSCTEAAGTSGTASGACRAVPDVAGDANPSTGVAIDYQGQWQVVGGTSAAAPQWAALVALADSGCRSADQVGELNTKLYPLASGAGGSSLFDEVTTGNNDLTGNHGGQYPARPGYNLATGWGTPQVAALVGALQPAGGCPVVSGLSASSGLARGASPATLTISGVDLAGASAVHFGPVTVTASHFTVASGGTSITLVPPPAPPGVVTVTVTTANGTSGASPAARFDYVGPSVSALDPSSGPVTGGQLVTITGSGFDAAGADPSTISVEFGSAAASQVTVVSSTTLTAITPAGSPGPTTVVVSDAQGSSAPERYDYLGPGYDMVASDGGVFAFGDAGFYGSTGAMALSKPIVAMAAVPGGGGYWLVASDGGVFAFGDAGFYGSLPGLPAPERPTSAVVGMAAAPGGGGYWEVTSAGDVYSFGDAGFYGSTGAMALSKPIVAMAAVPGGGGYWLVASDGGVFAFGDAGFYGSLADVRLHAPIVGMTG